MSCAVDGSGRLITSGGAVVITGAGPQAIWQGFTTSTTQMVTWWPPIYGTPDTYNVYMAVGMGAFSQVRTNIVPEYLYGPSTTYMPFYVATGLSPATTYRFYATAVTAGQESNPSPILTITTLATMTGAGPTQPTAPTAWTPAAYSLPSGGTTWTATLTSDSGTTGTAGTGTLNATNCSFQYALANCSYGDTIVLTAGATYINSGGAYSVPAALQTRNGAGSPTNCLYVISSNNSSLPAFPTQPYAIQSTVLSGIPSATDTSATLSAGNWAGRTGVYPTLFVSSAAVAGYQLREAKYTTGSPTIQWTVGLESAASNATAMTWVLTGITPSDLPNMPTIQTAPPAAGGTALKFNSSGANASSYIRFVGIYLAPQPSYTGGSLFALTFSQYGTGVALSQYITFDRCIGGNDSALYGSTFSFMTHGFDMSGNYINFDSCYVYGIYQSGQDSTGIISFGGGPCTINNCYLQAASECVIWGGGPIDRNQIMHDLVISNCVSTKLDQWNTNEISHQVKNHFEMKCCQRYAAFGNTLIGGCQGAGQNGEAFGTGVVDQNAGGDAAITNTNPWNVTTDVDIYNNFVLGCGVPWGCYIEFYGAGNYVARQRMRNNLFWMSPTIDVNNGKPKAIGFNIYQSIVDLIIDHNTIIYNPTNFNENIYMPSTQQVAVSGAFSGGISDGGGVNPGTVLTVTAGSSLQPGSYIIQGAAAGTYIVKQLSGTPLGAGTYQVSPSQFVTAGTNNLYGSLFPFAAFALDRVQVTNNILDGVHVLIGQPPTDAGGVYPDATHTLAQVIAIAFQQSIFTNNVSIFDSYGGTASNYYCNGYANLNLGSFVNNTTPPTALNAWNIVSGTYFTASTTGGPLGAIF
jgi:hypothetical protein